MDVGSYQHTPRRAVARTWSSCGHAQCGAWLSAPGTVYFSFQSSLSLIITIRHDRAPPAA